MPQTTISENFREIFVFLNRSFSLLFDSFVIVVPYIQ